MTSIRSFEFRWIETFSLRRLFSPMAGIISARDSVAPNFTRHSTAIKNGTRIPSEERSVSFRTLIFPRLKTRRRMKSWSLKANPCHAATYRGEQSALLAMMVRLANLVLLGTLRLRTKQPRLWDSGPTVRFVCRFDDRFPIVPIADRYLHNIPSRNLCLAWQLCTLRTKLIRFDARLPPYVRMPFGVGTRKVANNDTH